MVEEKGFYYRYVGGYSQRQLEESILNPAMRGERVRGREWGQADQERSQEGKREPREEKNQENICSKWQGYRGKRSQRKGSKTPGIEKCCWLVFVCLFFIYS